MRSKVFKNGNSQAVRIPAEIAYSNGNQEVEVMRDGDRLIITPVKRSPADILRKMKPLADFMSKGRGAHEQKDREPL